MFERIDELVEQARKDVHAAPNGEQLEAVRVRYLGKHGLLSGLRKALRTIPDSERPRFGKLVTEGIDKIDRLIDVKLAALKQEALEADLGRERIDVTLPGRPQKLGHRHPVSQAMEDIIEIFARLGFHVADGPEIEWDVYNFGKLCFPVDHPARDMQDTFSLDAATLPPPPEGAPEPPTRILRTHTSPVQIRAMLEARKPPIRVITPGKAYRCDSDITHTPMFHQVECLHVEEGVSMAHLRGTLDAFAKAFFGPHIQTRLRPSYFPFTEPSAEVDISHPLCGGKGCKVCKGSGWLEVLGAGMVNPDELAGVGIDLEKYTGYAFGVGIDRLAMLRHGIDDLRLLFDNDVRFLQQL